MRALGGLAARWPVLGAFALIGMLSSVGLPGLNGFVGEFLIVFGTFQSRVAYAVVAVIGIVVAAVYLFTMFRRVMHGPPQPFAGPDLSVREIVAFVPLIVLIVAIGVYPSPILTRLEASVDRVAGQVQNAQAASVAPAPPSLTIASSLSSVHSTGGR